MWLLPALIHLLPFAGATPLGAYYLPIFVGPFLAAWLFDPFVAVAASLLMPMLNHTVTGMPNLKMTLILTLELVVFSLTVSSLRTWKSLRYYIAAFAVLVAKLCSLALVALFPALSLLPSLGFFVQSVVTALPGIVLLTLLNVAMVKASDD
jgi:hypothetical protein